MLRVAGLYNMDPARLRKGGWDCQPYNDARKIAMYLVRAHIGASYQDIGKFFGARHHSTVMYDIKKIHKHIALDPQLKEFVESFGVMLFDPMSIKGNKNSIWIPGRIPA